MIEFDEIAITDILIYSQNRKSVWKDSQQNTYQSASVKWDQSISLRMRLPKVENRIQIRILSYSRTPILIINSQFSTSISKYRKKQFYSAISNFCLKSNYTKKINSFKYSTTYSFKQNIKTCAVAITT